MFPLVSTTFLAVSLFSFTSSLVLVSSLTDSFFSFLSAFDLVEPTESFFSIFLEISEGFSDFILELEVVFFLDTFLSLSTLETSSGDLLVSGLGLSGCSVE